MEFLSATSVHRFATRRNCAWTPSILCVGSKFMQQHQPDLSQACRIHEKKYGLDIQFNRETETQDKRILTMPLALKFTSQQL
jgi:hypothetical protein